MGEIWDFLSAIPWLGRVILAIAIGVGSVMAAKFLVGIVEQLSQTMRLRRSQR